MMKKKQEELIEYLYKHNRTTSEELSKSLSISIRTVKSYISDLNFQFPELINSNNRGYEIDKHKASVLLHYKDNIPQDYDGRCIYIIKKLLLEKQIEIDLFDICDELFISDSTLKNDIYKMNTSFANFNITFSCQDNKIKIYGSEKNKRKLITHVMSEEASGNFLDLTFLQESFPDYDIEKACNVIKDIFQKHHYYINDFSFINLILHVTIMINRIHNGNHIADSDDHTTDLIIEKHPIITELCTALEDIFQVTFTSSEMFEVYILFKTNANFHIKGQGDDLSKVVPQDILTITKDLIQSIDQHYFVDLSSESFMTPFALHLKNLKQRLLNHTVIKNPMLESIKISCPTIYDISTFMAYQLMQIFGYEISEDEIAFLALHVGTEIERKKSIEYKVSCIILCPEYLNVSSMLYNKILMDFGEQVEIKKVISFENELENEIFDLLITTIPVVSKGNYLSVLLSPFNMNYEKNKIMDAIIKIENKKKGNIIADNISLYFNPELFYIMNDRTARKEEIIELLADQMISLGYVASDFKEEVWKRENASSTAFMNIAIPHPMKMSAYKTSIAVAICPKGVKWTDSRNVNVIFMIAFNKLDNKHFHELYESLISLVNEQDVISEIKKCKDFDDFKNIIIHNYIRYN
ncbi:BglG family transcription antiterminator [Absiella sp. AM29-15]|uniref:BglG family transcription antiterminator n=1 Tax=Absiella sp. AM29-15 TaxID=2292278 RepID=UPI001F2FC565|nr:PTS sugar transporter subunit IIA [Absiella sp. AM29-15]